MSISYISLLRHHRANPAWLQQKASSSPTSRSLLSFLSGSLGIYGRAKGGSVSRRLMSTLGGESMIGKPFMRVVPELPSSLSGVVFGISCFDVCSRGPGGAWSLRRSSILRWWGPVLMGLWLESLFPNSTVHFLF